MTKKKKECKEPVEPETGLKREFITSLKIEQRNHGKARALMIMVEIPANVPPPSYGEFVVLASRVLHDALPGMDLYMCDADVMAWSDRRAGYWLENPYMYRVNATFVPEDDLCIGGEEEEVDERGEAAS